MDSHLIATLKTDLPPRAIERFMESPHDPATAHSRRIHFADTAVSSRTADGSMLRKAHLEILRKLR